MLTQEIILEYMLQHSYKPITAEELVKELGLNENKLLLEILRDMEVQGIVILNRKGRYGLPQKMNLCVGRLQGNPKGFGFLIPDDPIEQDVFIPKEDLNGAMHNDRVIVRLYRHLEDGRRREGSIIRILKRANEQVVGTFESSRNFGFVIPDDKRIGHDIFIPKEETAGAKNYEKVVVTITRWPEARRNPEGKVIEVLGHKNAPGTDVLSIVRKFRLPEAFPSEVLNAAERIPLKIADEELHNRKDLRSLPLVTIDGEDAKDLDDAVSLEILSNGNYYLGVHIADVGYYVKEGSLLDQEALKRATSVYLVDRVIPMLPQRLSNGICSLNANEDRLAMTCFMEINEEGTVVNYEICSSVIEVKERMTYKNVRRILEDADAELLTRYGEYLKTFELMRELCLILRAKRLKRGAIDFDFPEAKVILDETGKPVEIVKRERSIAEMIIEEFMIAANETVAEQYYRLEVPFLYRVHEEPALDDITELNEFLGIFGYFIKTNKRGEVTPQSLQRIVEKTKGQPEERAVSMTVLRSMKHARYAPEAIGHFGLAADYYSHFTSPIRRYPDLAIHRVIREFLEKGSIQKDRLKQLKKLMIEYATQSSMQERIAEDAERESVDLKKVEYMKDTVGQTFTGFISGVKSFGFFVELPNTVEGLIHVSNLNDDYYLYDERHLMLVGEHTKKVFRIGDTIEVKVARVDVEERQIDFELVEDKNNKIGRKKKYKGNQNLDSPIVSGIIK
ncbi:MAG: ribonuclease R [Firmicutes bacterium HGW-Firmicutes-12]|nr:MAG: ribonuclease R [Firmicutes bacterium HGW-Firmicutes-12]